MGLVVPGGLDVATDDLRARVDTEHELCVRPIIRVGRVAGGTGVRDGVDQLLAVRRLPGGQPDFGQGEFVVASGTGVAPAFRVTVEVGRVRRVSRGCHRRIEQVGQRQPERQIAGQRDRVGRLPGGIVGDALFDESRPPRERGQVAFEDRLPLPLGTVGEGLRDDLGRIVRQVGQALAVGNLAVVADHRPDGRVEPTLAVGHRPVCLPLVREGREPLRQQPVDPVRSRPTAVLAGLTAGRLVTLPFGHAVEEGFGVGLVAVVGQFGVEDVGVDPTVRPRPAEHAGARVPVRGEQALALTDGLVERPVFEPGERVGGHERV